MSRSRLFPRLAAGALATALAAAGLTAATTSVANATVNNVSPDFGFVGTNPREVTFTAAGTYSPGPPTTTRMDRVGPVPLSACFTATAGDCPTAATRINGTVVQDVTSPVFGEYTASYDLTNASPGPYDIFIGDPSDSETCGRICFNVIATGPPAPASVTQGNFRPGVTLAPFTVNGARMGAASDVVVLFGGQPDTSVQVFSTAESTSITAGANTDTSPDTTTALTRRITISPSAPGGLRDVRVTNGDGQSAVCAACFSVDSLLIDSVTPTAVPNSGLRRIAVFGRRIDTGANITLTRSPAVAGQGPLVGFNSSRTPEPDGVTSRVEADFDFTGVAPGSGAYLITVTNPDGSSGICTCRLGIVSAAPTVTAMTPASAPAGTDDAPASLTGTNFSRGAKVTFSNAAVTAAPGSETYDTQTELDFLVDVAANAPPGKVNVTVTLSDGQAATCTGCFEVTAAPSASPSPSETTNPGDPDRGLYTPIDPVRIVDTRDGTGGVRSPLSSGETRSFQVRGRGGIPDNASSVAFNLTAISPSSSGFLTAFPSNSGRPVTSNINFARGDVIANLVVVRIGSNGAVSLYNNSGTTNVAVDAVGYFSEATGGADPSASAGASASATATPAPSGTAAPSGSATPTADPSASATDAPTAAGGSRFRGLSPARVLDTRDGNGGEARPIGPGESRQLQITGRVGVPADATAIVVNLTAISSSASGFLTAFPTGATRPTASTVNFVRGEVIPNLAIVRIGTGGRISIYNNAGSTNAAGDVVGYFAPSSGSTTSFTPVLPQRIFDSRDGSGSVRRPLAARETRPFRVTNLAGVPSNATAVVFNLTAISPSASGFLTAFPTSTTRPTASNVNFVRGLVIANLVVVPVGNDGNVNLFNSAGSTNAAADVVGYFAPFVQSTPTPSVSASSSAAPTTTATTTPGPSTTASAGPSASASATSSPTLVSSRRSTSSAPLVLLVLLLATGSATAMGTRRIRRPSYARRH